MMSNLLKLFSNLGLLLLLLFMLVLPISSIGLIKMPDENVLSSKSVRIQNLPVVESEYRLVPKRSLPKEESYESTQSIKTYPPAYYNY